MQHCPCLDVARHSRPLQYHYMRVGSYVVSPYAVAASAASSVTCCRPCHHGRLPSSRTCCSCGRTGDTCDTRCSRRVCTQTWCVHVRHKSSSRCLSAAGRGIRHEGAVEWPSCGDPSPSVASGCDVLGGGLRWSSWVGVPVLVYVRRAGHALGALPCRACANEHCNVYRVGHLSGFSWNLSLFA